MGKVIGIDLGTGNSCVAVMEGGKPTVIANAEGQRTTPSVINIKDGNNLVGQAAKRKMTMEPKNTVHFIKRFMGANYSDPDVQKMLKQISYDVVNENGKPRVKITNSDGSTRLYSPEEISSFILAQMKKTAEDYYGCEVTDAVITCPAWFKNPEREATKLAGELAGLKVHRVINEPTAAILSSSIKLSDGEEKTVAVVDLGCGTLDISVCELSVVDGNIMVEVLSSYGDVFLGGADFDNAIVQWLVSEFKAENGVDLSKDPMAYSRIIEAAEKAKCELSSSTSTEINIPYITATQAGPLHMNVTLTRAKYEQLTVDLIDRIIDCTRKSFEKANKTTSDINEILLVGGMTRSLNVQEALTKAFGLPLNKSANPDEAVALGAVLQANVLAGDDAGSSDILLLDVTPITLGIETEGGVMTKLIEANTTIPTKKTETFSTAADNQTAVTIHVLQGERPMAAQNKSIGQFNLEGIAPARRGVPQIEVTFDIDANGILKVSAKDKATGKEQAIRIEGSNGLSKEEIERIKADAEANREADEKKRKDLEELNEVEKISYGIKSAMEEEAYSNEMSADQKKAIEDKINEVSAAVKEQDAEKAKALGEELMKLWNPIAEAVMKKNGAQAQQMDPNMFNQANNNPFANSRNASSSQSDNNGPDVEDVPYEEVK